MKKSCSCNGKPICVEDKEELNMRTEVAAEVLEPCCRDGKDGDWWGEKHEHCTGSHSLNIVEYVRCTCKCHKVKELERNGLPKSPLDTFKVNAADLDLVQIGCECGNLFDMPWDASRMGGLGENSFCGQCGESGKMTVVADPSPNKPEST